MSKRPNVAEAIARKAAADVAAIIAEPEPAPIAPEPEPAADPGSKRGRPRGRREVHSRQTLYLDQDRYDAIARIAEGKGRSIHSVLLEAVDAFIGKPEPVRWKPRE